jgi:predicted Zn finger-like uncharacterized protein
MLIVCPSCASEYTIDLSKLGADGRTVRCAICRDTWFVSAQGPAPRTEADAGESAPDPAEALSTFEPVQAAARSQSRPRILALALVLAVAPAGWAASSHLQSLRDLASLGVAHGRQALLAGSAPRRTVLTFRGVTAEVAQEDGGTALAVTGEIVNGTQAEFPVPHLEILVRNGEEKVLAAWTDAPPRAKLGPGEAVRFTLRLPSPPPDARQVRVQFTTADGIAAAMRPPST